MDEAVPRGQFILSVVYFFFLAVFSLFFPSSLTTLPPTSPSTYLILLKLLSIANAPDSVQAGFRAYQGLKLIKGETRGGA
jgi:hypothetical protein